MATDEPTNDEGLVSTPQSAGSHLRAAREAAGLSLDQVAQQLKLAPRQVRALEDEAFDELPGRTFTRGFVRNYARLLGLDAATLIALLPDAAHAPSLESPPLQSTLARMGELPSAQRRPASFGRWLIPLILVACVVAAAAYEWYRGKPGRADVTPSAQTEAPAPASSAASVPLPNPVTDKNPGEGTPAADANLPVTAPAAAAQPTTTPAPAAPVSANPASAPSTMSMAPNASKEAKPEGADAARPTPGPSSTATAAASPATGAKAADERPSEGPLHISYSDSSWTEIRDRRGRVLISRTVSANSSEAFDGTPPFSVVLGNADAVTVVYRGAPVDLTPHTRANVARLVLR